MRVGAVGKNTADCEALAAADFVAGGACCAQATPLAANPPTSSTDAAAQAALFGNVCFTVTFLVWYRAVSQFRQVCTISG
jgi:hypothetical protein